MPAARTLKDRIEGYIDTTNYKLTARLPLILTINGKSFSKISSSLDKPFDEKLAECFYSTTERLCTEIEGTILAYHYNDEIVLILRNDQNIDTQPWLNNNIQKIVSLTSSIASVHFNDCATSLKLNVLGDPFFTGQICSLPNMSEVANLLIYKQQHNLLTSIHFACFYELLTKYNKETIKEMLVGLTIDEKKDLLWQECHIDFNKYPSAFRRGVACYKAPRLSEGGLIKNKWIINKELPIFTKDQEFLNGVLR